MTTKSSTSDNIIHIALCDDQPEFIKQFRGCLSSCLEKKAIPYEITPFLSGEALLASAFPFDIIFLDIRMDHQSGLDTARILRESNMKARIVFLTAYKQYALEAFEVEAFHYLVKPVSIDKLNIVLNRLLKAMISEQNKYVVFKTGSTTSSVCYGDIFYIEVIERKIYLHTAKDTLDFYGKIQQLEEQLGTDFFRCHRSYLVNLSKVVHFDKTAVTLSNGDNIPLSKRKFESFSDVFFHFIRKDSLP